MDRRLSLLCCHSASVDQSGTNVWIAEEKHFTFPIAVDGDWTALKRWWLTKDRDFTSVSFLVDQNGIIRYVHRGGEFHEGQQGGMPTHEACNRDMHFIQGEIEKLLNT
jgi:hypothetical protein